jgi:hypothetical protein
MADKSKPEVRNGLWPTRTITWGHVTVTVERKTVRHGITVSRIMGMLPDTDDVTELFYRRQFARIVAQTTAIEGLDVSLPDHGAGAEAVIAAYEAFFNMDGDLLNTWYGALEDVDRPPAAQEHWPSHRLDEAVAKNPTSAG